MSSGDFYTKQLIKDVGLVLSVCLQDVLQVLPKDPIDYMAHWLYKYENNVLYFNEEEAHLQSMEAAWLKETHRRGKLEILKENVKIHQRMLRLSSDHVGSTGLTPRMSHREMKFRIPVRLSEILNKSRTSRRYIDAVSTSSLSSARLKTLSVGGGSSDSLPPDRFSQSPNQPELQSNSSEIKSPLFSEPMPAKGPGAHDENMLTSSFKKATIRYHTMSNLINLYRESRSKKRSEHMFKVDSQIDSYSSQKRVSLGIAEQVEQVQQGEQPRTDLDGNPPPYTYSMSSYSTDREFINSKSSTSGSKKTASDKGQKKLKTKPSAKGTSNVVSGVGKGQQKRDQKPSRTTKTSDKKKVLKKGRSVSLEIDDGSSLENFLTQSQDVSLSDFDREFAEYEPISLDRNGEESSNQELSSARHTSQTETDRGKFFEIESVKGTDSENDSSKDRTKSLSDNIVDEDAFSDSKCESENQLSPLSEFEFSSAKNSLSLEARSTMPDGFDDEFEMSSEHVLKTPERRLSRVESRRLIEKRSRTPVTHEVGPTTRSSRTLASRRQSARNVEVGESTDEENLVDDQNEKSRSDKRTDTGEEEGEEHGESSVESDELDDENGQDNQQSSAESDTHRNPEESYQQYETAIWSGESYTGEDIRSDDEFEHRQSKDIDLHMQYSQYKEIFDEASKFEALALEMDNTETHSDKKGEERVPSLVLTKSADDNEGLQDEVARRSTTNIDSDRSDAELARSSTDGDQIARAQGNLNTDRDSKGRTQKIPGKRASIRTSNLQRRSTISPRFAAVRWHFLKDDNVIVCDHSILGELRTPKRAHFTADYLLDRDDTPCEVLYDSEVYVVCDRHADDMDYTERLMHWTGETWVQPIEHKTKQKKQTDIKYTSCTF
ncbi:hypothetical protein EGW08_014876 [Elysia chlorotica]|uniref:Uncharacterized protein n=1 Tax=Elysia chlorotica TaxID=188477 RepID=A0A3S0ZEY3_ELYCH|nr:hypothetical protein EGW08_014876 [Elysia chlorotica]